MRQIITLAALAVGLLVSAPQAQAQPAAFPLASADIQLVSGGCGPRGHRDRFGYCRPNRPPPRAYRQCPRGFHPTPYGCRRSW